jgi:tetratricopeptide (TPR) repeat protein
VLQGTPESIKALWEAATYIERALLLTPYDATRWSNLAEFERRLMNWQNALICARRGHDCDSKDSEPLSELVVIFTNLGDWSEASEALEKLEMIGRTAWSASVAARLHLYGGRAETALARIDDALSSDPHNLGYLGIKSLILRRLGRWSESLEIATVPVVWTASGEE